MLEYPTPEEIQSREFQEQLYSLVAEEIRKEGILRPGLWALAISDSAGDENKAKALYIRYRAQSLIDESFKHQEEQKRDHARKIAEEKRAREDEVLRKRREAAEAEARRLELLQECRKCKYLGSVGTFSKKPFCTKRQINVAPDGLCESFRK